MNCSAALSQDETENKKGFSLGITFAPQFYNWHTTDSEWPWVDDLMDSMYIDQLSFLVGLNTEFELSHNLAIRTGLNTSIYRSKSIIMEIHTNDPLIESEFISFKYITYFLELPIILKYNFFHTDQIKLFAGAGINNKFHFYNVGKTYAEYPDTGDHELMSKSGGIVKYITYYMAAEIDVGIDFTFSKKISTGFYPSFEYAFLNLSTRNRNLKRNYYLLGLNFCVAYKF